MRPLSPPISLLESPTYNSCQKVFQAISTHGNLGSNEINVTILNPSKQVTVNRVFPIAVGKRQNLKPHGFLKIGKYEPLQSAAMEALVYRVAELFHVEDLFVPTTMVRMANTAYTGSLQPTLQGMKLTDFVPLNSNLTRTELIPGFLASLVFGMFDAHSGNIFIKDRKLIFFDNARCFPHSNDIIYWSGNYIIPYRSSILELNEAHLGLNTQHKQQLRVELEKYKTHLPEVESFFSDDNVNEALNIVLPPHWLQKKELLTALKKRIDAIDTAIDDPNVTTLRDMAFTVFPYLRFLASLSLLKKLSDRSEYYIEFQKIYDDGLLKQCCGANRKSSIASYVGLLKELGINIDELLVASKNSNIPYVNCMQIIVGAYNQRDQFNDNSLESTTHLNKILSTLIKAAEFDFKDGNPEQFQKYVLRFHRNLADSNNITWLENPSTKRIESFLRKQPALQPIIVQTNDGDLELLYALYRTENGKFSSVLHLDFQSIPGKFIVEGNTINFKDLQQFIVSAEMQRFPQINLFHLLVNNPTSVILSNVFRQIFRPNL
jgi:hypothetical protein